MGGKGIIAAGKDWLYIFYNKGVGITVGVIYLEVKPVAGKFRIADQTVVFKFIKI